MKSSANVCSASLVMPYFYTCLVNYDVNISVGISSYTYLFSRPILNKLDLDQQILVEALIEKFHEN
jgi:hypothetical protein